MRRPIQSNRREIYLSVAPSRLSESRSLGSNSDASGERSGSRDYDVLIYSNMAELGTPTGGAFESPSDVGGLPLLGREQIRVRWNSYADYLELFLQAEKGVSNMRERLLETLTGRLEGIFDSSFGEDVRVWFHASSPELDELPWELLAFGPQGPRCSFVRGIPGDHAPLTPVNLPLQLGLVGSVRLEPAMRDVLCNLGENFPIQVKVLGDSLRSGIRHASAERCELLHVVTDGAVTSGLEGLLVNDSETLSPRELRSLLADSRIGVVGLSPAATSEEGGQSQVHRAFAHLGSDVGSRATMVAPVGPMPIHLAARFWASFYDELVTTLSVEKAMLRTQRSLGGSAAPVAIFLAHRLGTQFVAQDVGLRSATAIDPPLLNAQISSVRSFVDQIARLGPREESPERKEALESLVKGATDRINEVDASLDAYRDVDGVTP